MAFDAFVLVALLSAVIIGCEMPVSVAASDSGICTVKSSKYVTVTQSQQAIVYYTTGTLCWDAWEWFYCEETRSRYATQYSLGAQIMYFVSYQCCNGYQKVTSSPLTCTPICSSGCVHGECTSPGHCQCVQGWEGDDCNDDINECAVLNGGCSHTCSNTMGSYNCLCPSGYSISIDGHTCQDIPECTNGDAPCTQSCTETPGSYECGCYPGYSLSSDGYSCIDVDECAVSNGGCQHGCNNTNGSFSCYCNAGFFLLDDGSTCSDHNECELDHQCSQSCHNVPGGYYCSCYTDGYRLHDDGLTCTDIDECDEEIDSCDHVCTNTVGSFNCSCHNGYHLLLDGHTCADNDECATSNGGCDHVCVNSNGTYHCECQDGFTLGDWDNSSCVAEPCEVLVAPINGFLSCDGGQVTNQSCTIGCESGYSLVGPTTRTCLPNHTWDGENITCAIKKCDELTGSEVALIIQPCETEYQSVCSVLCNDGYQVNVSSTGWVQSCALSTDELSVQWTQPLTCVEKTPCDPDPCNGGQCIAVTQLRGETCDCGGTLLMGQYCHLSILQAPTIGVLVQGSASDDILLQVQAGKSFQIVISSDSESIQINQNQGSASLDLSSVTGRGTFNVLPLEQGLYSLSYSMGGNSLSAIPEDSPILVLPQVALEHVDNNYFISQHLDPGKLAVGCCEYDYFLPMSTCPSDLILKSSCMWVASSVGNITASTGGVVFMTNGDIELPLSIAGVQLLVSTKSNLASGILRTGSNLDLQTCNAQCQPKDRESAQTCLMTDRSVHFDEYDLQDMLEHNSLVYTFVEKISPFLPSWLVIQVLSGLDDKKYAPYDFSAYFGFQNDLRELKGCGNVVPSSARALYALRTDATLQITIQPIHYSAVVSSSDSLCFVVDICDPLKPSLTFPFLPQLATVSYLEQLADIGWDIHLTSITFILGGISKAASVSDRTFWDGNERREVTLPNYDLEMEASFTGSLAGGETAAELAFDGSMLYKGYPDVNEVPGLLFGDSNLRLTAWLGEEKVIIVLTGDNQPSLFTYPGTSPATNLPFSSGIYSKLNYHYKAGDDSMFFDKLLEVPEFTKSCPIDVHISLTDFLDVEQISLHNNCTEFKIGNLLFSSGLEQTILLPGVLPSSDIETGSIRVLVKSNDGNVIRVSNLVSLLPDSNSDLVDLLFTSSSEVIGTISKANISVLDSQLTASIDINDSKLSFHGDTKMLDSFDVTVSGSFLSTSSSWNEIIMDLEITFLPGKSSFQERLSSYLSSYIEDVVEGVIARQKLASESNFTAQAQFLVLQDRLKAVQDQLVILYGEHSIAQQQRDAIANLTIESEALLVKELDELISNKDHIVVCTEQPCNEQCISGFGCAPCHSPVLLEQMDTCSLQESQIQIERMSNKTEETRWGYKRHCWPCWGVEQNEYSFLPWKVQCCQTVSVPYSAEKLSYYDQSVVGSRTHKVPCVDEHRNQSLPLQCCQCEKCATFIHNPDCIVNNSHCRDMQQKQLLQVEDKLAVLYAAVSEAKNNYTIAELKVSEIEYQLNIMEQNAEVLKVAYEHAHNTTVATNQNVQAVMEQTKQYDQLVQLLLNYSDPMEVILISEVLFTTSVSDSTPVEVPVNVMFDTPYSNQSYLVSVYVDFRKSTDFIIKTVADEVLGHFLSTLSSELKVQRRDLGGEKFDDPDQKYITVLNVQQFFDQLHSSLNVSVAAVEGAVVAMVTAMSNVSSADAGMNTIKSGSTDEELSPYFGAYDDFINSSLSAILQIESAIEDTATFMWQGTMELLQSDGYTLSGESCAGFADCLRTSIKILETLLRESPSDNEGLFLEQILSSENELLELSYVRTLSIAEAQARLQHLIANMSSIAQGFFDLYYQSAPQLVSQPPLEVIVTKGATLSIECEAKSSMPFHYQWIKDGIILVDYRSSNLTITNVQVTDAGTYSCSAINDVGTAVSLQTMVSIVYSPVFNHSLRAVEVYEGDDNGASLTCDAYSQPASAWSWSFRTTSAEAWQEIEGVGASLLTINNPQHWNEGWYRCTATNLVGSASEIAYLTVLKASIVRVKYPVSFDMSVDSANSMLIDSPELETNLLSILVPLLNSSVIEILELSVTYKDTFFTVSLALTTPSLSYTQNDTLESVAFTMGALLTELEEVKQSLVNMMNDDGGLVVKLPEMILTSRLGSLQSDARVFVCPAGRGLHSNMLFCVSCSPGEFQGHPTYQYTDIGNGEYIKEEIPQCSSCPVGYYQSGKEATECLACFKHSSTLTEGSTASSDCVAMCQPGTYSETGLAPCKDCPPRYCQQSYGFTSCNPCSLDETDIPATSTSDTSRPSPSADTLSNEGGSVYVIIGPVAGSLVLLIVVTVIALLVVIACKKHTKHQISIRLDPRIGGELNSYDDASIATGLSEGGDQLKMKELKKEIESMDTSTPFSDPIYDFIDDTPQVPPPYEQVDSTPLKPELPQPRFSLSPSESPSASPSHPLVQPPSSVCEPLPPPIASITFKPPHLEQNAKSYLVPVLRDDEEVTNPAYSSKGSVPYYQQPRTHPDDHVGIDDNGYMEMDMHMEVDDSGYVEVKREDEESHTGN